MKKLENIVIDYENREECARMAMTAGPAAGKDSLRLIKTRYGFLAGSNGQSYLIEDIGNVSFAYLEKIYNRCLGEAVEIFENQRFILRELTVEDAPDLFRIMQQESVKRFMEDPDDDYEVFLDKLASYKVAYGFYDCGFWGIFEKNSNRIIGECGVQYSCIEDEDVLELGFLLDEAYVGKNYGYEASLAAIDYAFNELNETEIYARTAADNMRALKLLERLGFRKLRRLSIPYDGYYLYILRKPGARSSDASPLEIEKKYLIKNMPDLDMYESHEIEQAYISRKPVLRIRKRDDEYIFTYKSKAGNNKELQVSREIEENITKEKYEALKTKADGHEITKTRYIIPLADGLKGELDVFHGRLEGLVFIEVEFENEEKAAAFTPPGWFGPDVTADGHYRNGYLSTLENLDCFSRG